MSYRIYVTDLAGEVRALLLALLRIKEERNALESGEQELLARLKGLPGAPGTPGRGARPGASSDKRTTSGE